ncbi:MAG TPA: 3-phenylpropionate/cinnamic acid dioxygenase subunit beta [Xanthobacteraceae bacterium]|jgi:3-phenylpropionate/cinnamic acid dioxygenase small subunit|nr:3-phenylpropionate/cinnamic acid dioxygenase subunit beta [Xanthobacteraceae bacterium]
MKGLAYFELKQEVEDFLYAEAELLDQRQFKEWLDLLDEELVYFMPMRRNVKYGRHAAQENTRLGEDISWFDEDKWTLSKRVEQIMTGVHWAEEPLSRVCHVVSNIQIVDAKPSIEEAKEVSVRSRFIVYQNRLEDETNFFVGKRTDTLRQNRGGWKLLKREIILDQNVLLAKALTVLF